MYIRYLFWGVAAFNLLLNFADLGNDLVEAADPDGYRTTFDAYRFFLSGVIGSFTYFFYAELYALLYKRLKHDG